MKNQLAPALHGKNGVTNRVHIAWTQTGHQSILVFTFSTQSERYNSNVTPVV